MNLPSVASSPKLPFLLILGVSIHHLYEHSFCLSLLACNVSFVLFYSLQRSCQSPVSVPYGYAACSSPAATSPGSPTLWWQQNPADEATIMLCPRFRKKHQSLSADQHLPHYSSGALFGPGFQIARGSCSNHGRKSTLSGAHSSCLGVLSAFCTPFHAALTFKSLLATPCHNILAVLLTSLERNVDAIE